MLYEDKSINILDDYYAFKFKKGESYKLKDCKKIQKAFLKGGIALTLLECKEVYETYSEERWCAEWENGIDILSLESIFNMLLPILINLVNDRIERIDTISEQLINNDYVTKEDK